MKSWLSQFFHSLPRGKAWVFYFLFGFLVSVPIFSLDVRSIPQDSRSWFISPSANIPQGVVEKPQAQDSFRLEKEQAARLAEKLHTPLNPHVPPNVAQQFLQGGYGQPGYGVPAGAAVDGSHAFEGIQGYFVKDATGRETGKEDFLRTVDSMGEFFKKREERLGKPVKLIIKLGIGGQHTPFQGIASVFEAADSQTVKIVGEYELGKNFETSISEHYCPIITQTVSTGYHFQRSHG